MVGVLPWNGAKFCIRIYVKMKVIAVGNWSRDEIRTFYEVMKKYGFHTRLPVVKAI